MANDNWQRLALYDRIRTIKLLIRRPFSALVWHPERILYISVPLAAVWLLINAPKAFETTVVNVRVLDDVLAQAVLIVLGSYAVVREVYMRRMRRIEASTPELLERLASLNEAGMTVVEGIERVRGSDLGVLSAEVERIYRDIQLGANVEDAFVRFGRRVRTVAITRVVMLLVNAMRASGKLGQVLRIAATQARDDLRMRRRRRQQMLTYLIVIYISFLVFLVIIVAVDEVLVPSLPSNVPTPDRTGRLGINADQFARLGRVDKASYTLVFFHTVLIHSVFSGLVAGQLGEGTIRDGAKHAAVLLAVAYVVMILLSSPVASLTMEDPSVEGGTITVDSASLSEGGFVVIRASDPDGEILGHSTYLGPGTHRDVSIPISGNLGQVEVIVAVPHLDTDGDREFSYDGGSVDHPYPDPGIDEFVAIKAELR